MCFHYKRRDLSSRNTLKMSEMGVGTGTGGTAGGDIASSPEKKTGCGLLNAFFGRKAGVPRRSTSTGSIPTASIDHAPRIPTIPNSKRRRGGSDEAFLDDSSSASAVSESDHIPSQKNSTDRIISRPPPNHHSRSSPVSAVKPQPPPVPPPSNNNNNNNNQSKGYYGRKVPQGTVGLSGELESMIADHQKAKGSSTLVRASSSNVMLFGNLGNLRQGGAGAGATVTSNTNPNSTGNNNNTTNGRYSTSVMGNVVMKKQNEETEKHQQQSKQPEASLCRAISTRMDPEELKILGNEDYKNGRFAEALSLYEAAISIDPNKASYRSNKSAALTALGRLLEAAFECREAIRIEPQYQRAHNRLATLYVRLGEAENALYHYKHAGAEADPDVQTKAKKLQVHLNKCTEAKMQRDWKTLIRETGLAISAGADSAPQIFALKAEAYLKLHRYQDAEETMKSCPKFDDDECTKFFGPIFNAGILVIRAQIDQTAGRFDNAVAAAQLAVRLDSNNREASVVARRTRAVATARLNGNQLFKTGRFSEACVAYGEGLEHDPYNAVLLCNRAACRSKLGQHEKALEDCNSALNIRPSFSKARLRRGNCLAKLEKWEACIQDFETLLKETPDDEEIEKMLKEARGQLKKQRGGGQDLKAMNNAIEIVLVTSEQCFRDYVTSSGISVVLFCNKSAGSKPIMQFLEQLQRRYSSVNFLKVEVEDQPNLAKSEGVGSLPAFKIYRNGSKTKDIPGNNHDLLESTIQLYIS